jgi:antitoxin ParD1/3/4
MNVHLTPKLEQFVQKKVTNGPYNSVSEVVREALRLLIERDELMALRKRELRRKIANGLDSLRRGDGIDGEEFFAQLEREEEELARKRSRA